MGTNAVTAAIVFEIFEALTVPRTTQGPQGCNATTLQIRRLNKQSPIRIMNNIWQWGSQVVSGGRTEVSAIFTLWQLKVPNSIPIWGPRIYFFPKH